MHKNSAEALSAQNDSDIIIIDTGGEVVTTYVFADNYFEMYINGNPVGKDKIPFTKFNSSIIRFKVKIPFTAAMLLIDWETHLGVGFEISNPNTFHMGDGGGAAVFINEQGTIIGKTDKRWKAQTFYISGIKDLSCVSEMESLRLSDDCNTDNTSDDSQYYGLHWNRPQNWMTPEFDDSGWPDAYEYTNTQIGVNGKAAYSNFTNIFDAPNNDAMFIWSSNIILDNEVLVRSEVGGSVPVRKVSGKTVPFRAFQSTDGHWLILEPEKRTVKPYGGEIVLYDMKGKKIASTNGLPGKINIVSFHGGLYILKLELGLYKTGKKILLH